MDAGTRPSAPHHDERSFLEALMDTRFDSLITPRIVRVLYIVAMIGIAIGAVVSIIGAFTNSASSGIITLILSPFIALLFLTFVRLFLESIMVFFKIREAADEIVDNTERPGAAAAPQPPPE